MIRSASTHPLQPNPQPLGTWSRWRRWLLLLALLPACSSNDSTEPSQTAGNGDQESPAPLLQQKELSDLAAIRQATQQVTPAHESIASQYDSHSAAAMVDNRFGPAAKAAGTACLYAPTGRRLYALASAKARIPRPRDTENETRAAKAKDYASARKLLDIAHTIAEDPNLHAAIAKEHACYGKFERQERSPGCDTPVVP